MAEFRSALPPGWKVGDPGPTIGPPVGSTEQERALYHHNESMRWHAEYAALMAAKSKPAPREECRWQWAKATHYIGMGYPESVAKAQAAWDLDAMIDRAYAAGATYAAIGVELKRTRDRVRQRALRHAGNVGRRSPIEVYAQTPPDMAWQREC